jgi:hypothetical protein
MSNHDLILFAPNGDRHLEPVSVQLWPFESRRDIRCETPHLQVTSLSLTFKQISTPGPLHQGRSRQARSNVRSPKADRWPEFVMPSVRAIKASSRLVRRVKSGRITTARKQRDAFPDSMHCFYPVRTYSPRQNHSDRSKAVRPLSS